MDAVTLESPRLRLDLPTIADADLMAEYCQDPLFERFMPTPWPYAREDAITFISDYVQYGWNTGREATWAIRKRTTGTLMGVIGARHEPGGSANLGYWLGGPHRRLGYTTEAASLVIDWVFSTGFATVLHWECVVGNSASVAVARAAGFRYTGQRPATIVARDASRPDSWHAELRHDDRRDRKPGWPA